MGAIVGGVVGGVLFIIVLIVVAIIVKVIIVPKLSHQKENGNGNTSSIIVSINAIQFLTLGSLQLPSIMPSVEVKLKLKLTKRGFEKLDIKKNCTLREAIKSSNKMFKRGQAYYEFIHEKENISEDKELIFMNKVE